MTSSFGSECALICKFVPTGPALEAYVKDFHRDSECSPLTFERAFQLTRPPNVAQRHGTFSPALWPQDHHSAYGKQLADPDFEHGKRWNMEIAHTSFSLVL